MKRLEAIKSQVRICPVMGCWLWTGSRTHDGYGKLKLCYRTLLAHRVSYEEAYGFVPDGCVVAHACHEPLCCNPNHLRAETQSENLSARNENGTAPLGQRNGRAALTDAQARVIHHALNLGMGKTELGRVFGVSRDVIRKLASGDNWATVTGRAS